MKHSEMIEIIFKRLGPIGISEPTCIEVLGLIEKAGMIPPMYKKFNYSKEEAYITNDHLFGIDNSNGFYIEKYEWEPEDT